MLEQLPAGRDRPAPGRVGRPGGPRRPRGPAWSGRGGTRACAASMMVRSASPVPCRAASVPGSFCVVIGFPPYRTSRRTRLVISSSVRMVVSRSARSTVASDRPGDLRGLGEDLLAQSPGPRSMRIVPSSASARPAATRSPASRAAAGPSSCSQSRQVGLVGVPGRLAAQGVEPLQAEPGLVAGPRSGQDAGQQPGQRGLGLPDRLPDERQRAGVLPRSGHGDGSPRSGYALSDGIAAPVLLTAFRPPGLHLGKLSSWKIIV